MAVNTLVIDEKLVSARANQTILEVARENNIHIPTLCHLDGISEIGGCRLCLVEIAGTNKLQPACVTLVSEGMEICTSSERLRRYRQMMVELLFSERNHICSVCVANGHCELQGMAVEVGMNHVRFDYLAPTCAVDITHPRFGIDQNRCVLCTRCVRVCDEIEGAHTWDVMGRGIDSRVITDLAESWGNSETCTSCGKCVQVCPTGALFEKGRAVSEMVRRRQFLSYLAAVRERRR